MISFRRDVCSRFLSPRHREGGTGEYGVVAMFAIFPTDLGVQFDSNEDYIFVDVILSDKRFFVVPLG